MGAKYCVAEMLLSFGNLSLWPLSRAWLSSSIALLATRFAFSTFMFVLLFRGAIAPFVGSRGGQYRNGGQKRRDGCVQVGNEWQAE